MGLGYLKVSLFMYLYFGSISEFGCDWLQFDLAEIRVRHGIMRKCDGKGRSWNWRSLKV